MTKVRSHIIGVRKKADSQKGLREAKSLGNPGIHLHVKSGSHIQLYINDRLIYTSQIYCLAFSSRQCGKENTKSKLCGCDEICHDSKQTAVKKQLKVNKISTEYI